MSIYKIIFSPTGGTDKVADIFANVFNREVNTIDLTDFNNNFNNIELDKDDICIIAVPSYGGRVPDIAVKRLKMIKGNGSRAVLIAVYGNRDYEDTLLELKDTLYSSNFYSIAAVAAVAEHSVMNQIAKGRPDDNDIIELNKYAKQIKDYIETNTISNSVAVPGNKPYKEYNGIPLKPSVNNKVCSKCGLCARKCPVEAISATAPYKTDKKKCISCMRCIQLCPANARKVNGLLLKVASMKMKKTCAAPKPNELFIH